MNSTSFCLAIAAALLGLAGCGDAKDETDAQPPKDTGSPFSHLRRPALGTASLAPGVNTVDFKREFPNVGEIILVGVPVDRLIGAAYGQHPKDIVFRGRLPRVARWDAFVRPQDHKLETAQEMLRDAVRDEFQIERRWILGAFTVRFVDDDSESSGNSWCAVSCEVSRRIAGAT